MIGQPAHDGRNRSDRTRQTIPHDPGQNHPKNGTTNRCDQDFLFCQNDFGDDLFKDVVLCHRQFLFQGLGIGDNTLGCFAHGPVDRGDNFQFVGTDLVEHFTVISKQVLGIIQHSFQVTRKRLIADLPQCGLKLCKFIGGFGAKAVILTTNQDIGIQPCQKRMFTCRD